jgi:TolB-like protein/Flp pilus assembly protein TadD
MRGQDVFRFGPFELLPARRELLLRGAPVQLGARAFDLLLALVRRQGQLATKDELMAEVWPNTVVEENNLQVQISALRKALGGDADGSGFLQNVPGRGYRFAGLIEHELPPSGAFNASAAPGDAAAEPLVLPDKPSIAVLPFTNMSGDPEQEYFADGIAEDVITALARFPSLFVIARNSSFTYKGRAVGVKAVGQELGVRYVLEGSVRKAGSRVRVAGQLVQADNGMHVWAERYDADLSDIFALQDEMSASVVGAVVPSLQGAEIERARRKPPGSLDAYDLYLRALPAFYSQTQEGNRQALQLVEQALALDPSFVAAVILGENCWSLLAAQGWLPAREAHPEVMRYARRAVQIDKDNAEAVATLARRVCAIERDYEEAASLAERAVMLNPNSAVAWRQGGYALVYCGRPEAALEYLQRAVRLSPRDPRAEDCWAGISLALIQLERDKEAIVAARKGVQGNPNSASAWRAFAAALALTGQMDEAQAAIRRLLAIDPACTLTAMAVRYGYTEAARARYFEGMRKAGLPQ